MYYELFNKIIEDNENKICIFANLMQYFCHRLRYENDEEAITDIVDGAARDRCRGTGRCSLYQLLELSKFL